MDDLISEKEQIEQIRSWWSEYGGYIILGVAIGALLLFGFSYYKNSKETARLEASGLYESLANDVVDGDLDAAEAIADRLGTEYSATTYSAQAKLAIARLYMDKNRDQDAADVLRELIDTGSGEALEPIARLRLARILLYQDKPEDVVALLEGEDDSAFAASFAEVLGDAYFALGRIAEAEAAYQRVLLDPVSQGTVDQQLVQWKVLDLPKIDGGDTSAESAAAEPGAATEKASSEEQPVTAGEEPVNQESVNEVTE